MVDEGPRNLTLDLWAREHGKAVDCEYPILTTDGWKRHRDVEVGDFVYGPEGDARRVIATSETFETECYEVTFNDGSSVVCSGNHLWEVGTGSSAWTSVMSTEELFLEHDDYDYPVKQNIAAQGVPSKEYSYAYITSIKEVPTIPTNCLQVEAEDGLYLIGESFITTHNSTILTENRTVQDLLVDSSRTIVIFSYTKVAAEVFARNTRNHFEMNDDLKALFPDIIWEKPHHKVTWGDSGFTLRRPYTQRECSVEPWGLLEGMPTGRHFKIRRYDDISTFDLAQSPTSLQKMKEAFAMSMNVGGDGDEVMVTGTPYHHDDVLMDLRKQVRRDGSPLFTTRVVPATHDGTIDGEPVYLSDDRIELLKQNRKFFNSQQLLDPTPSHEIKLPYSMINMIRADQVPNDILKVMVIDPAGLKNKDKWRQDAWAMWVVGMQRNILDHGSFNIYILDGLIARLRHEEMARAVVNLYTRNMPIRLIGIEKVGASSAEIHVSNALRSKGHMVTIENGRMRAIHPKGSKTIRIESLAVPLYNGAVFMVDSIQDETRSTLREEMEKFPAWHDDGLDSLAMAYELFKDPQFSQVATRRGVAQGKKPPPDPYETGTSLGQATSINWMAR
jgi:predicted phage terminase large subunit-like protein